MISIIVPVYNTIKYLPKCVDSILAQTYRDFELILVDDGSTDGSGKLCDEYAVRDERVRAVHKENGGSSSARNLGIGLSRGEYIGFIDSDDFIEPDMYESLYTALTENGGKIAQVGRNEIDEKGNILPDICIPPEKEEVISARDFFKELLMHRGDCSFCTKLISRDLFYEEREDELTREGYEFFPTGVLNEDFHILIKRLKKAGNVISLPGYKYHVFYRLGSNSRKETKKDFSRVFADSVDNADLAYELVGSEYPEDKELEKIAVRFGIFQRIEYLLHIPVDMMKKPAEESAVYNMYRAVVRRIRKDYFKGLVNPYLTAKNKVYMTLFAIAPRGIRLIHKRLKGIE